MLTPREFAALERVYHKSFLERWALERAHFFNAHFKHPQGRHWAPEDFVDTAENRRLKADRDREAIEMAAVKREEKQQIALMKAGQFPEEELPAWARMTPEEKQRRGIQ